MQSWFFGEPLGNINHALKPIKNCCGEGNVER